MLEFNATILFVFISFIIFMVLMKLIYFDPMLKLKAERDQKTVGDRELAVEAQNEYYKSLEAYEEQLSQARQKANAIIQEKREEAVRAGQAVVAEARLSAQQDVDQKMAELASQQAAVCEELFSERELLKQSIIQKVKRKSKAGVS